MATDNVLPAPVVVRTVGPIACVRVMAITGLPARSLKASALRTLSISTLPYRGGTPVPGAVNLIIDSSGDLLIFADGSVILYQ